jgi:hypothetical protein
MIWTKRFWTACAVYPRFFPSKRIAHNFGIMSLSAGVETQGGTSCLGKDLLGSVRSASGETGQLEERYEYDAFGKPYRGDLAGALVILENLV